MLDVLTAENQQLRSNGGLQLSALKDPETGKHYSWNSFEDKLKIKEIVILHMTKGTSLTLDQTCHVLFQLLAHQPTKGRAILKGLEAIEVLVKVVMKAEGIPQSRFPASLFHKIHDLIVWAGK